MNYIYAKLEIFNVFEIFHEWSIFVKDSTMIYLKLFIENYNMFIEIIDLTVHRQLTYRHDILHQLTYRQINS